MRKYYSLYGRMLEYKRLYNGFKKVCKSKGVAGIDGQSISEYAENLEKNLKQLQNELGTKEYKPEPIKRVEIPKEGGGTRVLGIPAVRDRIVQQTLLEILQPIFDPEFHPSSYGYRPNRSSHDAIKKASLFIRKYERKWVVDMDLSKCFDRLDHKLILESVKSKVTDGSILNLIEKFLKSGAIKNGIWQASELGSPQGGVISPLLANIYLDKFDQEMKNRNHRIVRYADDILILCVSRKAAENAYKQACKILEKDLKLTVNEEKTQISHSDKGVEFLGVKIYTGYTRIQERKLKIFKQKVKEITKRNNPCLESVIKRLNPLLRGFSNYFRIANCSRVLKTLSQWIRRRLRAIQLKQWKRSSRLHRRLKQMNCKPPFKHIRMNSWRNSASPLASLAMPNKWFVEIGLFNLEDVQAGLVSSS